MVVWSQKMPDEQRKMRKHDNVKLGEQGRTYHYRVNVDQNQTDTHDQIGHEGQGRQILEVTCEDQQYDERKQAEHVEPGVKAGHQH